MSRNIFLLLVSCLLLFTACNNQDKGNSIVKLNRESTDDVWIKNKVEFVGNALGTTFVIKTSEDSLKTTPQEIDSIFTHFNKELSTYIPNSLISQFNNSDNPIDLKTTDYFQQCFELSYKIYIQTQGAFDPTVYPLVAAWGFFKDISAIPTPDEVDSILEFTGMKKDTLYTYKNGILTQLDKRFKLVFNAIAKGQAVDVIAQFLDTKGQEDYYIEIGGEIYVKGLNGDDKKWIVGVDLPIEENTGIKGTGSRPLENMINISNRGMATSGNYRDYFVLDGKKYSHTIDPKSGHPIRQRILSATVVAKTTAIADAYATAFMVMGVEESLALIKNHPELDLDAYLLYRDSDKGEMKRAYSSGMAKYLEEKK